MALQKISYKEARPQMKPGDVIAFGGKGHFSEIIKFAKIYLPLTLVISMAVSAGCAPESEEPLELIGLKTDGSLPTPEQMKTIGGFFGYINETKRIVYVDEESRSVVAELMGVQVEGDRWIRTEGGETTEFSVLGLSELDLQSGDDVGVKGRVLNAECKLVRKNTCNKLTGGSLKLSSDTRVCVAADEGSFCDYEIKKVDGEVWLEQGCPEDPPPIEIGIPLFTCT